MKYFLSLFLVLTCFATVPVGAFAEEINDPIEPVNRGIFWFNDHFDRYLLEPVARGYDWALPGSVKESVTNFFGNLEYPQYLVSDIVQLKFTQAAEHTARFLINSTLGLVGLFDVAKDFGFKEHEEDFGIALAYHGVPSGPYIVLPFLGPSNLRDAFGRAVDTFLDPVFWAGREIKDDEAQLAVEAGVKAIDIVNTRANLIEAIETARSSSLDYYLFVQSAYYQYRQGLIYDGNVPDDVAEITTEAVDSEKTVDSQDQASEIKAHSEEIKKAVAQADAISPGHRRMIPD